MRLNKEFQRWTRGILLVSLGLLLIPLGYWAETEGRRIGKFGNPEGGQWIGGDGLPLPETENSKSREGFAVSFFLTTDEGIYDTWAKPETPTIVESKSAACGATVLPVVIFVNPMKDSGGDIYVTFDLTIVRPDGTVEEEMSDIPCGSGAFVDSPYHLQLSESVLKWYTHEKSQFGTWTFKIVAKDNVSGIEIPLATSIELTKD